MTKFWQGWAIQADEWKLVYGIRTEWTLCTVLERYESNGIIQFCTNQIVRHIIIITNQISLCKKCRRVLQYGGRWHCALAAQQIRFHWWLVVWKNDMLPVVARKTSEYPCLLSHPTTSCQSQAYAVIPSYSEEKCRLGKIFNKQTFSTDTWGSNPSSHLIARRWLLPF